MGRDADISIGYYRGPLDALLIGLENAQLDSALIELDGGAEELDALIDERTAAYPDIVEHNRRARDGVRRLGPTRFVEGEPTMPIENDNLAAVRALLERHADQEDTKRPPALSHSTGFASRSFTAGPWITRPVGSKREP